jgi:DNA modification methylase
MIMSDRSTTNNSTSHLRIPALANDLVIECISVIDLRVPNRLVRPPTKRATATAQHILSTHGQVAPIIVDSNGVIIVGLEFYEAAKALGWTTIKIVRLEAMTDEARRALTIALHRIPELSDWDDAALAAELHELKALNLDFDLGDATGFTIGELDVILDPSGKDDKRDPLDQLPQPSKVPVTQAADIWQLADHRIICGSCLDGPTVALAMNSQTVAMLLTDPPYNIAIKGNVSRSHEDFQMGVGEQSREQFIAFLTGSIEHLLPFLPDGALLYVFMDRRHLLELQLAAEALGLTLYDLAIWNKGSGGMGSFYRSQHEPCMIFKKGTAPHRNNIELGKHGRYRTNVWDHRGFSSFGKGREEALAAHPTVKPVALLAEAIKDCTKRGDIIVDPFLGSGSTLLAAEKTGRIAYGVELEPKYVDVAIQRWQKMTGKSAILEATGETFAEVLARRTGAVSTTTTVIHPAIH